MYVCCDEKIVGLIGFVMYMIFLIIFEDFIYGLVYLWVLSWMVR